MSELLPDPPIVEAVDLRSTRYMGIDIPRLFGSRFHAISNDSEWRAGVTLWLKSLHQFPAGSLPDDDIELCRLAELGRDIERWHSLREVALHGWYRCSDGRLYHDVIAEYINDLIRRYRSYSDRGRKASEARWRGRKSGEPDLFEVERLEGDSRPAVTEKSRSGAKKSVASRPEDVPEGVWNDFLALRKAKRAPLTDTALSAIRDEAVKAGVSLADALRICCMRGWQGFRADWYDKLPQAASGGAQTAPRVMAPRTVEPDWSKMDYGHGVQSL